MGKFYNVWREDRERWASVLTPHGAQNPDAPRALHYFQARQVVEYMRSQSARGYEVREIQTDGASAGLVAVGYNVWMLKYERWTQMSHTQAITGGGPSQNEKSPDILSMAQANELRSGLVKLTSVRLADCAVMEIASTLFECCDIGVIGAKVAQPVQDLILEITDGKPVEPEMNWAVYCGFEKAPPKKAQYLTKIDPYTGLPKP